MLIEVKALRDTGVSIGKAKFKRVLAKYRADYARLCHELYNDFFQTSPSVFDNMEFVKALREEGYKEYLDEFLTLSTATYSWTFRRCDYVLRIAKAKGWDENFISVISTYRQLLFVKEAVDYLEDFDSKYSLSSSKTRTIVDDVRVRFRVDDRFEDVSLFGFKHPAVREVIHIANNSKFVSITTKDILYREAIKQLGVSDEIYEEYKSGNKPFFINALTMQDEIDFLEMILTGDINLDGLCADRLYELVDETSDYRITRTGSASATGVSFYSNVFKSCLDERIARTNEMRKDIENEYKCVKPFYVTNDEVIYQVTNDDEFMYDTLKHFEPITKISGTYLLNYADRGDLPLYNVFDGFAGEFISAYDIEERGYYVDKKIKPLRMKTIHRTSKRGEVIKVYYTDYYNIADVCYSNKRNMRNELIEKNLEPWVGNKLVITSMTESDLWILYGAVDKDAFYKSIRDLVTTTFPSLENNTGYLDYVAELVCGLKYVDAGIIEYDFVNKEYSYVTEEMHDKACFEANLLFAQI